MKKSAGQTWNPQQYVENARFVSDLGAPVVELLAPCQGERILDIGCGDGLLGLKIMDHGCEVVAIDSSSEMVKAARNLGLNACTMDAESMTFSAEFDAVFSNAALHWMKRPNLVISGVWNALKPGGRFVAEFGGQSNVAAIVSALEAALEKRGLTYKKLNPWYFPDDTEFRSLLESQGFRVETITLFPRRTPLSGDLVGWLETFAQDFTSVLPAEDQREFLLEVAELCKAQLLEQDGNWSVDYVRLRISAVKP